MDTFRQTWRLALLSPALIFALGAGCAEPQRPYQFTTPAMAREPLDALAAALTQAGQPPVTVDPQTGIARTRWVDTGLPGAQISGGDATIVRRYSANLVRGSFGADVTLHSDEQRCLVRDFRLTEIDVTGTCLPLERIPQKHQDELIRLGQRLQQAMSIP